MFAPVIPLLVSLGPLFSELLGGASVEAALSALSIAQWASIAAAALTVAEKDTSLDQMVINLLHQLEPHLKQLTTQSKQHGSLRAAELSRDELLFKLQPGAQGT